MRVNLLFLGSSFERYRVVASGHGLISNRFVRHISARVKKGTLSAREGAQQLIKPCVCGVANPLRIEKIIARGSTD